MNISAYPALELYFHHSKKDAITHNDENEPLPETCLLCTGYSFAKKHAITVSSNRSRSYDKISFVVALPWS